jgi:hypothetical protein
VFDSHHGESRPAQTVSAPLTLAAGHRELHRVTRHHGTRKNTRNPTAAMTSRFLAPRVRPANHNIPRDPDGSLPECWLITDRQPEPQDAAAQHEHPGGHGGQLDGTLVGGQHSDEAGQRHSLQRPRLVGVVGGRPSSSPTAVTCAS